MAQQHSQVNRFGSRSSADEVLEGLDLSGKKMIITGANTGIGYEAARALAAAGAEVILACRSQQKGQQAVDRIQSKHPNSKVSCQVLDLTSFKSIKQFNDNLSWQEIDVLICNAGVVPTHFQQTEEGIELCVGVCHFGHFYLTQLLLPRLLKAAKPRVVMVSSESHRSPRKLNFEKFPLTEDKFATFVAYGQAKLCNALFANELQRRYGAQGLSACSLHPGALVTTDIGRNSAFFRIAMKLISPFTKNANQGASTTVLCTSYAKQEEIQGKYFSHCKAVRSSKEANNPDVAKKLWELSEQFCNQHA